MIEFFKAKMFCLFFGHIEIMLIIISTMLSAIFKDIRIIITVLIAIYVCRKKMIIARKGCLQIVKISKKYEVSMCKGFSGKSKKEIFKSFNKSFLEIFDKESMKKIKDTTIYINTHDKLIRGVIKLLGKKIYTKEQLETDTKKGYVEIDGYEINIRKLRKRKNKMLASAYPIFPNKQQLLEFKKANKEEAFYELRIPISILQKENV